MAALLLAVVVAIRDAAVPRKKRGPPVRAETSRWWSFSLPVPPPPPAPKPGTCGDCGVTETTQWRTGPNGRRTLCDTCGRRRWASGERWGDPGRRWQATPPTTAVSDQPPPDGPVFEGPLPEGHRTARNNAAAKRRSPSPAPETTTTDSDKPVPAPQNKKKYKYTARADKQCVQCGSSETPQWREGPEGRGTLCNACGVRHRQKRLLPEYRPQMSPTFDKENHASLHNEVLELRRQNQNKQQQPSTLAPLMPLPPPPPRRRVASDLRIGATDGASTSNASGAAGPSTVPVGEASYYLHPFLLDGPAAPLIVDEPDWMVPGPSSR